MSVSARILVVSDTHIPDFAKAIPEALVPALKQADLILHAGDVTSVAVLDQLAGYATVRAVIGNGDPVDQMVGWGAQLQRWSSPSKASKWR
jgi:uncharacterized protein